MKADSPVNAAQCGQILSDTAGKIDLHCEAWTLDSVYENASTWSFGVSFKKHRKGRGELTLNHKLLLGEINPSTEWMGWFGYGQNAEHPDGDLWVELYCGDLTSAGAVEGKLDGFTVKRVDGGEGWHTVDVQRSNPESNNDRDWFVSVFEKLGIKSV